MMTNATVTNRHIPGLARRRSRRGRAVCRARGLSPRRRVVARWRYDAWGNVVDEAVAVPVLASLRYRFQGREWSAATGLVNFRMRWYDPETGRWLSKDPIGLSGGMNQYEFCVNNPLNMNDVYGLAGIGNRQLDGIKGLSLYLQIIPGVRILMLWTDTLTEHEHIFFDNGENIGWGQNGFFCDETPEGYKFNRKNLDDKILRHAAYIVRQRWEENKYTYHWYYRNCQVFVQAVYDQYLKMTYGANR